MQVDRDLVDPADRSRRPAGERHVHGRAPATAGPSDLHALPDGAASTRSIVLGYRDALGVGDADARTLLTLLTLRMIWPAGDPDQVRIVAELLDQRNLVHAAPVGIDDLIVSDALASLMMAQLSEQPGAARDLRRPVRPRGRRRRARPAPLLAGPAPVRFEEVVAAGAAQHRSVFGYRLGALTDEVVMNPPKSSVVALGDGDDVILLEMH